LTWLTNLSIEECFTSDNHKLVCEDHFETSLNEDPSLSRLFWGVVVFRRHVILGIEMLSKWRLPCIHKLVCEDHFETSCFEGNLVVILFIFLTILNIWIYYTIIFADLRFASIDYGKPNESGGKVRL
jgi:hypothetical protein